MVDPSGDVLLMSDRAAGIGVYGLPGEPVGSSGTSSNVTFSPYLEGYSTGTTSHRFSRLVHSSRKHVVNVERSQGRALHVQRNFAGE